MNDLPTHNDHQLYTAAVTLVVKQQFASPSNLIRKLHIDYDTAKQLLQRMEHHSIVSPTTGTRARDVLITPDKLPHLLATITAPAGEPAP